MKGLIQSLLCLLLVLVLAMGVVVAEGGSTDSSLSFFAKIKQFFTKLFSGIAGAATFDVEAAIETYEDCVAAGNVVTASEPPQCTTPGGKVFTKEVIVKKNPPPEPVAEKVTAEPAAPVIPAAEPVHLVQLIENGFDRESIDIKVGEVVVWQNIRGGRYSKAMVIGTKACAKMRSGFFNPGESFRWNFTQPMTCEVVDGLYTTSLMRVIVHTR